MGDGGSVKVDPGALRKYGFDLFSKGQQQTLDVQRHLANVAPLVASLTTPTDAGSFGEGAVIAGIQLQAMSDFGAFVKDVTKGMLYMGSAAAVIAKAYQNGDVESAQDIGVIDFAFGDYGADKPEGLTGHNLTYSEQAAEQAAKAPQQSMASLGMDDFVTQTVNLGYLTIYMYQDGSQRMVVSSVADYPGVTGTKTTTSITDPHGKVLRSSSVSKGTTATGLETTVETQTENGQDITTVSTRNADGSVTVTTTMPGPDGKPTSTTVTTHPHTSTGPAQGPMQQAVEQYDKPQYGW